MSLQIIVDDLNDLDGAIDFCRKVYKESDRLTHKVYGKLLDRFIKLHKLGRLDFGYIHTFLNNFGHILRGTDVILPLNILI